MTQFNLWLMIKREEPSCCLYLGKEQLLRLDNHRSNRVTFVLDRTLVSSCHRSILHCGLGLRGKAVFLPELSFSLNLIVLLAERGYRIINPNVQSGVLDYLGSVC